MSGIQLPTVERMAPEGDASVGRLDLKVPDAAPAMRMQTEGVTHTLNAAEHYANKVEDEAADIEAMKRTNQYEMIYRKAMYGDGEKPGIRNMDGDPTELYHKMNTELDESFKSLTGDASLSNRAQEKTLKRMTEKQGQINVHSTSEFGSQMSKFKSAINDETVKLGQSAMVDGASYIKADDEKSFQMLNTAITQVRNTRLKEAMNLGSAVPDEKGMTSFVDENGQVVRLSMNKIAEYNVKKDVSDGLIATMDNAIKGRRLDVAKAIKERYGDQIDPVMARKLTDDFDRENMNQQAHKAAFETRGMGPQAVNTYLAKKFPDDMQMRDEAIKVINDNQRTMEAMQERSDKKMYQSLGSAILDMQNGPNPITTMTQLKSNDLYRNQIDSIKDPKYKETIMQMVEQPKMTSNASRENMQDLIFGNRADGKTMLGMSPTDFSHELNGMNKSDRTYYTKMYNDMNNETGHETSQRYKAVGNAVKEELILFGYVKKNQFNQIAGDQEKKLYAAQDEIIQDMGKMQNRPMTPVEIREYARAFAKSKAEKSAFQYEPPARFQSKPTTLPPTDPVVKGKTRSEWNKVYMQQNKKTATPDQLNQFIQDQE